MVHTNVSWTNRKQWLMIQVALIVDTLFEVLISLSPIEYVINLLEFGYEAIALP